jgi:hypothetical protein
LQTRSEQAVRRGHPGGPARWPGGWRLHGPALGLLALGGAVGLALWGKWGFLVAFDAIRAYCF